MHKSLYLTLSGLLSVVSHSAAADAGMSPDQDPSVFCDLAKKLGYPSRGFKQSTRACASNMQDVSQTPGKNGLQNNLAFYSSGEYSNPSRLQRISLILNVNNERETLQARTELARVAVPISRHLLGTEPQGLAEAIRMGASKTWRSGSWKAEVITTHWPTKLGHDVTVQFAPAMK